MVCVFGFASWSWHCVPNSLGIARSENRPAISSDSRREFLLHDKRLSPAIAWHWFPTLWKFRNEGSRGYGHFRTSEHGIWPVPIEKTSRDTLLEIHLLDEESREHSKHSPLNSRRNLKIWKSSRSFFLATLAYASTVHNLRSFRERERERESERGLQPREAFRKLRKVSLPEPTKIPHLSVCLRWPSSCAHTQWSICFSKSLFTFRLVLQIFVVPKVPTVHSRVASLVDLSASTKFCCGELRWRHLTQMIWA